MEYLVLASAALLYKNRRIASGGKAPGRGAGKRRDNAGLLQARHPDLIDWHKISKEQYKEEFDAMPRAQPLYRDYATGENNNTQMFKEGYVEGLAPVAPTAQRGYRPGWVTTSEPTARKRESLSAPPVPEVSTRDESDAFRQRYTRQALDSVTGSAQSTAAPVVQERVVPDGGRNGGWERHTRYELGDDLTRSSDTGNAVRGSGVARGDMRGGDVWEIMPDRGLASLGPGLKGAPFRPGLQRAGIDITPLSSAGRHVDGPTMQRLRPADDPTDRMFGVAPSLTTEQTFGASSGFAVQRSADRSGPVGQPGGRLVQPLQAPVPGGGLRRSGNASGTQAVQQTGFEYTVLLRDIDRESWKHQMQAKNRGDRLAQSAGSGEAAPPQMSRVTVDLGGVRQATERAAQRQSAPTVPLFQAPRVPQARPLGGAGEGRRTTGAERRPTNDETNDAFRKDTKTIDVSAIVDQRKRQAMAGANATRGATEFRGGTPALPGGGLDTKLVQTLRPRADNDNAARDGTHMGTQQRASTTVMVSAPSMDKEDLPQSRHQAGVGLFAAARPPQPETRDGAMDGPSIARDEMAERGGMLATPMRVPGGSLSGRTTRSVMDPAVVSMALRR